MPDRDEITRRWAKTSPQEVVADDALLRALRGLIAALRAAPRDADVRRNLQALAAQHHAWDELAGLLDDEARGTAAPAATAALLLELAEVHLHQGRAHEAEAAYRRLRAMGPGALEPRDEAHLLEELADVYETLLDQPLEAIAAVQRLVELAPDEALLHDRLARLFDRVGAWKSAAEAFEHSAEMAGADDRARAALRAAARIYREHGMPERAVAVYRLIISRRASDLEAWRGLDELLEGLGRWRELAGVRAALAERTEGGTARAALLRAQARALEQAGDHALAVQVLGEAAQLAPEDLASVLDRAQLLTRAGRGREAAALLDTRLVKAGAGGASAEDVAMLRLRLAEVLEEACADRAGAAAVLETLLSSQPHHLPALDRFVRLAHGAADPRSYAVARLRQAAALPAGEDKLAAILDAARRLRDQAHDLEAAALAFEQAVELEPSLEPARRELADVRAGQVVERARADARKGQARAAERSLHTLLAIRPDDFDATIALADILEDSGRQQDAAELLRISVAGFAAAPAATRGLLAYRHALVLAALGEAEDAHQLLLEAHRLRRHDLTITLTLGESCFARHLWREAALYLSALARHAEAPGHAPEVANGLWRAGQAEVRALRPERAEVLYEEAVRLHPGCTLAWHALAELAMERGQVDRAADCLEREAMASSDARDRVRLYDAIGDLALEVLGDTARAERCFVAAVRAGSLGAGGASGTGGGAEGSGADASGAGSAGLAASARQAQLLNKLLLLQRRRGGESDACRARGETCERLAELAAAAGDTKLAHERLIEAIDAYATGGDRARARVAAERLADAHPLDEDAIWRASELELADGDHEAAASRLGRALLSWGAAGPRAEADPRRAELWRRLGDARRLRGDLRGAEAAYDHAIIHARESDAALGARRGLVGLAAVLGRSLVPLLRPLVDADREPAEILALARALAAEVDAGAGPGPGAGDEEAARAMLELAAVLGVAPEVADEAEAWLGRHPARVMASDESYAGNLDAQTRRELVDDPADAPLGDELEACWESAALLCADPRTALESTGFADAERVSPVSLAAAAALYPQIANALGGPTTLLYSSRVKHAPDLSLLLSSPPVVVLGPGLAARRAQSRSDADVLGDTELRFRIGRVIELARPRRVFAAGSGAVAFARLIGGLWHAFGQGGSASVDPAVAQLAEQLRGVLPVRLRARLTERLRAMAPEDLDPMRYLSGCERAADRAGLIACGHVGVAVSLAGGPESARHLVHLAASPAYLTARKKLGGR